ncbi:MAG: chloramphenicol-sensitive protein RarD [Spirochaetes bacterium]|nr:MAG: chloramphenicol-sensitive protein RarD [Spirochaetota bacterium]
MEDGGGEKAKGYLSMVAVYVIWGLLPAYWKLLAGTPPLGVMAHRALWAAVLIAAAMLFSQSPKGIFASLRSNKTHRLIALSSLSLAIQWAAYLAAIVSGKLVELSLGYFIYPLVVALLGRLVLKEKLQGFKLVSLALAALGVCISLASLGELPFLALVLAFSFAVYSLVKKKIDIPSLHSTAFELLALAPFALGYCVWAAAFGPGFFLAAQGGSVGTPFLLLGGGILTALTLLLFASGARRVPIFAIGLLQYISPTMVLLLGVFAYGEDFGVWRALSFGFVWLGIAVYVAPGIFGAMKKRWDN